MINHDILGLDITVHDAQRVTIVQSFQDLVQVELAFFRLYNFKQLLVLNSVDVLKHQAVGLALPTSH